MNFDIESITKNPDGPETLRVFLVTWPRGENEPVGKHDLDVFAKDLRTFERFRELVADEIGFWLDDRLGTIDGQSSDQRDDWTDVVCSAFDAGRRWQKSQAELAEKRRAKRKTPALDAARARATAAARLTKGATNDDTH